MLFRELIEMVGICSDDASVALDTDRLPSEISAPARAAIDQAQKLLTGTCNLARNRPAKSRNAQLIVI